MALVIDSGSAIRADVAGIGNHLGVVATRKGYDGGGIRSIVNHFSVGIAAQDLIVVPEALIELDDEAVVDRVCIALDFLDALEVAVGPAWATEGDDEKARGAGSWCAGGARIPEIIQNRAGSRDPNGGRDFSG